MPEALDLRGPAEEITLRLIAQLSLQELKLRMSFNPLGQHREA